MIDLKKQSIEARREVHVEHSFSGNGWEGRRLPLKEWKAMTEHLSINEVAAFNFYVMLSTRKNADVSDKNLAKLMNVGLQRMQQIRRKLTEAGYLYIHRSFDSENKIAHTSLFLGQDAVRKEKLRLEGVTVLGDRECLTGVS